MPTAYRFWLTVLLQSLPLSAVAFNKRVSLGWSPSASRVERQSLCAVLLPAVEDRVNEVLGRVGLAHKSRQNGLDLSSGETKRLGIARALVIEPEVFFLDEPTANLDPENSEIIEQIILSMKTAGKSTIIVVTHDPAQARRLGDIPLVMAHGKIVPL